MSPKKLRKISICPSKKKKKGKSVYAFQKKKKK